jgi:hypothetical protein
MRSVEWKPIEYDNLLVCCAYQLSNAQSWISWTRFLQFCARFPPCSSPIDEINQTLSYSAEIAAGSTGCEEIFPSHPLTFVTIGICLLCFRGLWILLRNEFGSDQELES